MCPLGKAHVENINDIPRFEDLFGFGKTEHVSLFGSLVQPWEVLSRIGAYLRDTLEPRQLGQVHSQAVIEGDVFIGEGTLIEAGALICGPVWIGKNCRIGHGATLRGNVIVGDGAHVRDSIVLGDSQIRPGAEIRRAIIDKNVNVPAGTRVGVDQDADRERFTVSDSGIVVVPRGYRFT